ncbi:uncharacterized protein LOC128277962 [Anopheles cruzii]|uniref:uncharacterized protein LOC128277962 n=1 Tax=Anopheles cruzii TaxID=68878 RepID=UPI0022EC23C6|nr:uncharacterized protein LOC128277962 [Anopheles cruzii]
MSGNKSRERQISSSPNMPNVSDMRPKPREPIHKTRRLSVEHVENLYQVSTTEESYTETSTNQTLLDLLDEHALLRENADLTEDDDGDEMERSEREPSLEPPLSMRQHEPLPVNVSRKSSVQYENTTPRHTVPPRLNSQNTEGIGNFVVIVIFSAISLLVASYLLSSPSPKPKVPVCVRFDTLESSFATVDDTLWDALNVSLQRATGERRRREPGTFLFLHHGATSTMNGFMENITKITTGCFGGTEPILLDSQYFKRSDIEEDFGVFIAQQTLPLKQRGVMVVRNLEDIPPKAAQAFHSFCDPEEPQVDRAVIYFTMDTSKVETDPDKREAMSALANAEHLLHRLWEKELRPEVLDPLIVRLTENVYRIV